MAKILLIEDDHRIRELVCDHLASEGHSVLSEATGMDGLQKATSENPDLILMDLSLPVMDGWEATSTIKADNNTKDINAVALLDNGRALDISQLTSLIKGSSFVIANDTGPAHIAAHVGTKGLTLFGKHTTTYKVSIERENFKAIQVTDLNNLGAEKVFEKLVKSLS